jgi:hypothetical protein
LVSSFWIEIGGEGYDNFSVLLPYHHTSLALYFRSHYLFFVLKIVAVLNFL